MEHELVATTQERQALALIAGRLDADPEDQPGFCARATVLAADLPPRIADFIARFQQRTGPAFILLRNLPTGTVPPTPCGGTHHLGRRTTLAHIQAIVNQWLGTMVAYEAQSGGQLLHDLAPHPGQSSLQTSVSYEVELDGHTEQCFSPLRPDFLSLACLRSDPESCTYVCPALHLLRGIPPDKRPSLFEPLWETGVDTAFRMSGKRLSAAVRGPFPLFTGDRDNPRVRVDETLTRGTTGESQELLKMLIQSYRALRTSLFLGQGDMLVLDNGRCMHGRSSYQPRLDGTDRFLVRGFILERSRTISFAMRPNDRTILSAYS